ncbi:hypothetical protein [Erythrobacter donghaensis]|uniref:hypothetical protein n=1 Tax=Erythrobacter donghaensis TaxID=267135 RepID=UPI001302DB02|nr:hypothetical protein [Erythrobacter donghaensis]
MGEDSTNDNGADLSGGGRRQGDRRKAQVPFEGPDRRQGDRRTGADRRTTPREESDG